MNRQKSEAGSKMEYNEKQGNRSDEARTEAIWQPEKSSHPLPRTGPIQPVDPVLAEIRTRFGLGTTYLPKDLSVQSLLSYLKHSDWRLRTAAARRLGSQEKGEEVRAALLSALHDAVPAVRAAAARALGDLDEQVPEKQLLLLVGNDADEDVRTAAVQALSALGERLSVSAITVLTQAFRHTRASDVTRSAIIYALGGGGKTASIDDLLREAMQDRDLLVREAAALMMGEQEEQADEEALLRLAGNEEEDAIVVQAAYQALGKLTPFQEAQFDSNVQLEVIPDNQPPHLSDSSLKAGYVHHQKVGNVEFDGIEPGSINLEQRIPVIAQALDNQWIPRTLLKALLSRHVPFESMQNYLTGLVRTEYLRSLINGEQVIMNRAFLYNNSVIARDYLQAGAEREAFKQLLEESVIVPFLLYERSPDERPQYTTVRENFEAWQQICQEIQMQCMRFSWQDEETNEEEIRRLGSGLHRFAQSDQLLNISHLARDLGLPEEQEAALRNLLKDMHTWSREIYDETGRYIRREEIYRRYITRGDPARRLYDGSKLLASEIKQLLDVAYNSNLAEALNGYLLTPVDSPTSLILQDWHMRSEKDRYFTSQQLIQMVRQKAFQTVQSGLYLRSIGLLQLQDIQVIRKTDEWHLYIESLQQLLRAPLEFAERANDVYRNYITLAQVITKLIEGRKAYNLGALTAEWRPDVRLVINVGGSTATVVWACGDDKPFTDAAEQKKTLPEVLAGNATVNVRLIIGDSSSPSKLHTSIDILRGKMHNAQAQWRDLCDLLVKQLFLPEFSSAQKRAEGLPNLNALASSAM